MSEPKSIAERLHAVLIEQLGVDPESIRPESTLVDDLGMDSLDAVELVMACEEEFGVEVDDAEETELEEKVKTVADAVAFIERKLV